MRTVVLASAVVLGIAARSGCASDWTVILLEPAGANQSKCLGASNGVQCGYVNWTGQGSATTWNASADSVTDISLGQGWISSAANAVSGDSVVVSGLGGGMGMTGAYLYSMSGGAFVNLSPPWSISTAMQGCSGDTQVGSGQQMMGVMLMWHGTADSVVNLTPPGWISAAAAGCSGDTQVGNGLPGFMGFGHPFLTHGSAASYVDLTPPGSTSAGVAGCDAAVQVGSVLWPSSMMGHACLWRGTGDSCVDLHPFAAASSAATACGAGLQAGNYVPAAGGFGQAVAWHGTADSAEDLHQVLVDQLGAEYVSTEVTGVDDATGDIVGIAYTLSGPFLIPHAVMWQAVPACPSDFNGDGFQDFFDYDDFVLCFETGQCPSGRTADFNRDSFVDFFDYNDFVAAFEAGC